MSLELFKSHVSKIIDSLLPGVLSHVVDSDLKEVFNKDFESVG